MSEKKKEKQPEQLMVEEWDGFPDDDEVFERIWAKRRAEGAKADPVYPVTKPKGEESK